jgi:hypothetical protein
MTIEQVKAALATSSRHIDFLNDGETAIVRLNGAASADSDEGQITFSKGRVIYAAFQFPETNDAVVLAQELAGAVASVITLKPATCGHFKTGHFGWSET